MMEGRVMAGKRSVERRRKDLLVIAGSVARACQEEGSRS